MRQKGSEEMALGSVRFSMLVPRRREKREERRAKWLARPLQMRLNGGGSSHVTCRTRRLGCACTTFAEAEATTNERHMLETGHTISNTSTISHHHFLQPMEHMTR